ncbi:MAG: hypothetical protein KIS77_17720 [Saprospiraceae bacterium]|nr:hypothetical protein [Saprospiraceae bacterium]
MHRYITQLEILATLRNLQPQTIQPIEANDIITDILNQQGVEKGIEAKTRIMVTKLLKKNLLTL